MEEKIIAGQPLKKWAEKAPLLTQLIAREVVLWLNPKIQRYDFAKPSLSFGMPDFQRAQNTFSHFASFLNTNYPMAIRDDGLFYSPLQPIAHLQGVFQDLFQIPILGQFFVKRDDLLPIAGSIKARGGFHEVLLIAQRLLTEKWQIGPDFNYSSLNEPKYLAFFNKYTLVVGSTGNLGLSIGILGRLLGFQVQVHMSNDAKPWKKHIKEEIKFMRKS